MAIIPPRLLTLILILLPLLPANQILAESPGTQLSDDSRQKMEMVHGSGCYRFGDDETLIKARQTALSIAQEQAIRGHRVLVESSTRVKNFQLENDIIQTASAAILQEVSIEKEERKNQEVCVTITAKLSPVSIEDMIRQRIQAKEISQTASTALVPKQASFGLKVWTNKETNRFLEGDHLTIFVKSDRDAYLKLDYFQANGTVIHLVPNIYRGQAFIKGGQTYTFGDEESPEQFVVNAPFGDETIKAIVSMKPFEMADELAEPIGESRTYLQDIQSSLRGIKLVAAAASVSLQTESQIVDEYKKTSRKSDQVGRSSR